jgi:hypothetical protein
MRSANAKFTNALHAMSMNFASASSTPPASSSSECRIPFSSFVYP